MRTLPFSSHPASLELAISSRLLQAGVKERRPPCTSPPVALFTPEACPVSRIRTAYESKRQRSYVKKQCVLFTAGPIELGRDAAKPLCTVDQCWGAAGVQFPTL
ncbi:hypothetical protein J1614_000224 [Plenodomus biglobosus]|nr:hypothetical protein J1614_000224 [Plenodomus biglobosus]